MVVCLVFFLNILEDILGRGRRQHSREGGFNTKKTIPCKIVSVRQPCLRHPNCHQHPVDPQDVESPCPKPNRCRSEFLQKLKPKPHLCTTRLIWNLPGIWVLHLGDSVLWGYFFGAFFFWPVHHANAKTAKNLQMDVPRQRCALYWRGKEEEALGFSCSRACSSNKKKKKTTALKSNAFAEPNPFTVMKCPSVSLTCTRAR